MTTTHEGSKWRQDDPAEDAPRQEPMRAGLKPAQRKAPTTDQKKVRRQMAKSAQTPNLRALAHVSECPECHGGSASHDASHWHMHGLSTHYLDKIGNDYVARHRETGQVGARWTDRQSAIKGAWNYDTDDWPDPRPQGGYPEEVAHLKSTASAWQPEHQHEMSPQVDPAPKLLRVKERTRFQPRTDLDHNDSDFDPYLVRRCPDHGSSVTGDRESQEHYIHVAAADHDHAMVHGDREHRNAWHGDGSDCWSCCGDMYIAKPGERESGRTASLRGRIAVLPTIEDAGNRTCAACGFHGAPVLGDTAPTCSRCGSYSLHRNPLVPGPDSRESRGETARYRDQGDYAVTSSLKTEATQFTRNLARSDGQILIQPGESIRLPTGFTTKVRNIRRHETSGDHYYVDTDMGTSVMPWSTPLEVVPADTQQQPSPGYADPRGNANQHPGNPSPFTGPQHSSEALTDTCPVCGGKTMRSQGTKDRCTRCGYTQTNAGGPSFSDSPQMIKPHSSRSAVARRAAEVVEQMKETL